MHYPVKTICMHGSSLSKYNNKLLWKYYDYKDFGIIGEPYFDIDFNEVFYLTDTGRRWNGDRVSVRDKVKSGSVPFRELKGSEGKSNEIWPSYHSTSDIIEAVKNNTFPQKAMITFHPQQWHDRTFPWLKELVWQNVKMLGKGFW